MVLRYLSFSLVGLVLFSCDSESVENTEKSVVDQSKPLSQTEAKNLYMLNCASCHGEDGTLKASNAADLSVSVMKPAEIEKTIRFGNDKGMMPYGEILSKPQVDGLVEFVQTLRK